QTEIVSASLYGIQASDAVSVTSDVLNVEDGGKQDVGDGLLWAKDAAIKLKGIQVSESARQSILINGAVGQGSSIDDVTLSGGDETTGILEQTFDGSGVAPKVGAGVQAITRNATQVLAIPIPPATPGGI